MGELAEAVRERPIIFSGHSVRQIRAGSKIQTRRAVTPRPQVDYLTIMPDGQCVGVMPDDGTAVGNRPVPKRGWLRCPYGGEGDRLWVRERWGVARCSTDYQTGGETSYYEWDDGDPRPFLNQNARYGTVATLHYAADGEDANPTEFYPIELDGKVLSKPEIRWRSPLYMPRWASRLTLEVTGVRVERLRDVSRPELAAEGFPYDYCPWCRGKWRGVRCPDCLSESSRDYFAMAWDKLNGKRAGCSWADNPRVWVVTFRRVEPEAAK